jgi:hypothetical protein
MLHKKGARKLNKFVQALYRNEKLYDYLINFIFQNKHLLISVRLNKYDEEIEYDQQTAIEINKVFHRIFMVLISMTTSNTNTQDLMWKYKDAFVFKELMDSPQDGELDLVLVITQNKEMMVKSRKLRSFVNSLNKRRGCKENFAILLEIYDNLLDYERMSFIKDSIIEMVFKDSNLLKTDDKRTRQEFLISLNLQEIIFHVLSSSELGKFL